VGIEQGGIGIRGRTLRIGYRAGREEKKGGSRDKNKGKYKDKNVIASE
jgi:hypothetical protein